LVHVDDSPWPVKLAFQSFGYKALNAAHTKPPRSRGDHEASRG
jgi:hypothetical protein